MNNLVESILNNNLVEANKIFESRLDEIMDKKLYEAKRQVAANMNEVLGGLSPEQIQARKKAGWKKASDVYPDPRERRIPPISPEKPAEKQRAADKQKQAAAAAAEPEPESKLKKLGTSVSGIMKKAEKEDKAQRLANIAARQQRLAARGHSDPGAHLRHAKVASATRKIVKPFKDTIDVVRGRQTDKTGTLGKVAGYLLTKDISG